MNLKVCIFCASSPAIDQMYFEVAHILALELLKNKVSVNYGGGKHGLMGEIAETYLLGDGKITGYIPQFMHDMGWGHSGITDMIYTGNMHERKFKMRENVDAVIALPGGIGTLEELLEVITLKQLGIFTKPIIIINTNDFYAPLIDLLKKMIGLKFMRDIHENLWQVITDPREVINTINLSPVWDSSAIKFAAVSDE